MSGVVLTVDNTGLYTVSKPAASATYMYFNLITLGGATWGNPAILGVGNLGFSESKSIRITIFPVSGVGLNLANVNLRGTYAGTMTQAWETYSSTSTVVRTIPANASILFQESSPLQNYSFRLVFEINDGTIPTKYTPHEYSLINFPYALNASDYIEIDNVAKVTRLVRSGVEPITLDYTPVKTFYPYTQIYTAGSEVKPTLEGKFRVMEN